MGIADLRREYESHGLDVTDVLPDPIEQFRRWYDEAVAAGVHEPNAMTVATVDDDGSPDARYVLVRGVDERGFQFFTNLRSPKAAQLARRPAAALVFGWLELHRQVRVRGAAEAVAEPEADAYFATRPRGSQIGAWASAQSAVLAHRAALEREVAEIEARFAGAAVPRPPHWGGWLVRPHTVELWQGRPSRLHDRVRYRRRSPDGPWICERLSP